MDMKKNAPSQESSFGQSWLKTLFAPPLGFVWGGLVIAVVGALLILRTPDLPPEITLTQLHGARAVKSAQAGADELPTFAVGDALSVTVGVSGPGEIYLYHWASGSLALLEFDGMGSFSVGGPGEITLPPVGSEELEVSGEPGVEAVLVFACPSRLGASELVGWRPAVIDEIPSPEALHKVSVTLGCSVAVKAYAIAASQ